MRRKSQHLQQMFSIKCCNTLPSSISNHGKEMLLDCSSQWIPHSSMSATPLVKGRKAQGTVAHYSDAWHLSTFQWNDNLTCCHFVHWRSKCQIHALGFFFGFFSTSLGWGHANPRQALIRRHIQTAIDSPSQLTSIPSQTLASTHTRLHKHAQSVWSVKSVPQGARRVTPLTGQTRLDSQQTDKY